MLLEQGSADLSYAIGDRARFRINIFAARGNYSVVMRRLPTYIPTVEEMQLPAVLNEIVEEKNGLVLVTGATGSGKSTTLAAVGSSALLVNQRWPLSFGAKREGC